MQRFACPEKVDRPSTNRRLSQWGNAETCSDRYADWRLTRAAGAIREIEGDIGAGRTSLDNQNLRKCLHALQTAARNNRCSNLRVDRNAGVPTFCSLRLILEGNRPADEPCLDDYHCKSAVCDERSDTCYGKCASGPPNSSKFVGRGELCGGGATCTFDDDLVCTSGPGNSKRRCQRAGQLGEGDACASSLRCEKGLGCVDGTCAERDRIAKGDTCDPDSSERMRSCEVGLVCKIEVDGEGVDETVSGKCAPPNDTGEGCYTGLACRSLKKRYCEGARLSPASNLDSKKGTCKLRDKKSVGESCEFPADCKTLNCVNQTCKKQSSGESDCTLPGNN